ncbi:hypothetical protein V8B55DRAFT_1561425 [Mucor lusitanicus]
MRPTTSNVYCDANVDRFDTDPQYPYTVGPPELVVAFFIEFVFKRTYKKYVAIGSDLTICYGLRLIMLVTEAAPISKDRKSSIIEISFSYESVNQYKKALMFLHEYQRETRSIVWPSPKKTKKIDRAVHCVIRDSYKTGQLIKILMYLWCSSNKADLREMFLTSLRHHMPLRDQGLRDLNFEDCICTIVPKKQHRGIHQAVALDFCLDSGKNFKQGQAKFACAMQHKNLYRCPVSAFAYLMYSLLQKVVSEC